MTLEKKICSRCVMDESAAEIEFDEHGICNFCNEFFQRSAQRSANINKSAALSNYIEKVKADGRGKRYDCVVGVSGGVDSSWVLVKAVEFGLRPLAVHMDNGWNSELAQNNISSLVKTLNVDLVTHVIDWQEYRNLMQAFFDADVVDIELLYDNAMLGVNYEQAQKFGIKHILGGMNLATEGLRMPQAWNHLKYDSRNIKSIVKKFGGHKLVSFPVIGIFGWLFQEFILRRKWSSILDLLEYNKDTVLSTLVAEYNYKPYPYKHYESVFTRFYQGYLLPTKFGYDKRRVHFSTLICSGMMSREEALLNLRLPYAYPSTIDLERDIDYFLKKMQWSEDDLNSYLKRPAVPHSAYPSDRKLYEYLLKVYKRVQNLKSSIQ